MSLNYTTFASTIANILVLDNVNNADFQTVLPSMIDYATNRIERDLDLINSHGTATVPLVSGTRTATLPTPSGSGNGPIYIPESASVITPTSTAPDLGTRNPLQRVSVEYLNFAWPAVISTGLPVCFALYNDTTMAFGPAPDQNYQVEVVGVYTPPELSQSNPNTWMLTNIPDLFVAASAVWGFGWQRDTGAASNDPQAPIFWEGQYQQLLQSAKLFEWRKRSWSAGWTPMNISPAANPPRP